VDDILVIAKTLKEVTDTKTALLNTFDARDMGDAKYFLGMTIERDRVNSQLCARKG
jgi:NifU-like protein involved in Fe-S cluster formation